MMIQSTISGSSAAKPVGTSTQTAPAIWDRTAPDAADRADDRPFVTSARRVGRVAMIAAEIGARFARERIDHDPIAWMNAPRAMFGGRSAIDACQDRAHFERGMLLHGLSLGLDARAEDLDDLRDVRSGPKSTSSRSIVPAVHARSGRGAGITEENGGGDPRPSRRLYSAIIADVDPRGMVLIFHARLATSEKDVVEALRRRIGMRLAENAQIRVGFDPSEPIAAAMVSDAMCDMLLQIAADPESVLGDGLDLQIEQRFAA